MEKMRQRVDTTTNKQETMATTLAETHFFLDISFHGKTYLGSPGMMRVFKQVPQVALGGGTETSPEIFFFLLLNNDKYIIRGQKNEIFCSSSINCQTKIG